MTAKKPMVLDSETILTSHDTFWLQFGPFDDREEAQKSLEDYLSERDWNDVINMSSHCSYILYKPTQQYVWVWELTYEMKRRSEY